ncbi:hypothetical protein HDV00_001504 [Rhizophlyctis rosea]|nr:hypothetical protein HDV00_001504 [Rhizophlyctis rosea]
MDAESADPTITTALTLTTHDLCAVCLNDLDPQDATHPVLRFPHGHALHVECYKQLRASGIHFCPLCRRRFPRRGKEVGFTSLDAMWASHFRGVASMSGFESGIGTHPRLGRWTFFPDVAAALAGAAWGASWALASGMAVALKPVVIVTGTGAMMAVSAPATALIVPMVTAAAVGAVAMVAMQRLARSGG